MAHVEGLGHNLFSIGQFCDKDLEVNFRSKNCAVRTYEGTNLLNGTRRSKNLYTINLSDLKRSPNVCLIAKASMDVAWL